MVVKSGFGIEHETHFVKVEGNGRFETSDGGISRGEKYDIKKDYDSTVHTNLELVSTNPQKKPHVIVKDLIRREKEGRGNVSPFGSVLGTNQSNAGSYHLNMTMPYDTAVVKDKASLEKYHAKTLQGMHNLRWLEPLMMGMIGGSSEKAIGNPDQPEGSIRQYKDSFANVGGTHLDKDSTLKGSKIKDVFGMALRTREGHSQAHGKYDNANPNLKLNKNLTDEAREYNRSRSIGDWVIKGYTPQNIDGNNPKTVEFRFPDSFSSAGALGLINFCTFAMENGEHTAMSKDGRDEKVWTDALRKVMEEGWNAQIDKKYFEKMAQDMKLDIDLPKGDTIRTDIGFELMNDALHKKNKDGFWVKNYLKDNKKPALHNFNRDNWQYNYKVMMNKDSMLESKTIKFLKALGKVDTTRSNGWMNIDIKDKKIVIRDLITNEIGLNYSVEDYKDILFLLESQGVLRIKTKPNGEPDKLKLIKSLDSDSDIAKIIKTMKENKDFFTDKHGLDDSLPEVHEPVVARTTRPETTRPFAPTGTIVRGENAPTGRHYEVSYATVIDPTLSDLVTTMEDILVESEFETPSGSQITWKIKIANELKVDGREANSVWVSSGRDTVYLILKKTALSIDVSTMNGEERALLKWVTHVVNAKNGITGQDENPTNSTTGMFENNLKASINAMFNKIRQRNTRSQRGTVIELSNAGIKTLQDKGVRIVSVPTSQGREYYLFNKSVYAQARRQYGENIRFIKSIPYYKKYKVELKGNQLILYKGDKIQQRLML